MTAEEVIALIRTQWDIPGLIADLREQKWSQTEPNRIDRMTWIGSYDAIQTMAQQTVSEEEWAEAEAEGFEHEIVDAYMEKLAEVISDATGKELRREHVYATFEEGEAFIGQYEDISAEELRAMGFEIEGLSGAQMGAIELIELGKARPKKRVPFKKAMNVAQRVEREITRELLPEEMVLVGSLRRKRPEIADIEFVVLPHAWYTPEGREEFAEGLRKLGYAVGGKLRKGTKIFRGIKIEIYIAHDDREMGSLIFMYTGDFQFNIAMRRKAKMRGLKLNQYGIWDADENAVLQSPDERDFFEFLEVEYHTPQQRSVATRTPEEKRQRAEAKRGKKPKPKAKKKSKRKARVAGIDEGVFGRMERVWRPNFGTSEEA